MSQQPLANYLRTFRRDANFHQHEIAFLLGCSGDAVARHESGSRVPSVESALGYEAIFGTAVRQLFAGTYQAVEMAIIYRAEELTEKIKMKAPSARTARQLELLASITSADHLIIPLCDES